MSPSKRKFAFESPNSTLRHAGYDKATLFHFSNFSRASRSVIKDQDIYNLKEFEGQNLEILQTWTKMVSEHGDAPGKLVDFDFLLHTFQSNSFFQSSTVT